MTRPARPPHVRASNLRPVRLGFAILVLWAVASAAGTQSVVACIGGTAFDWAVAHTDGGILRARVTSAPIREDFTTDLLISHAQALRGDPPTALRLHAVAGAICEQSADVGESIVVLFDVRGGQYPYPLPLFYVVDGPDALDANAVAAAFGELPATDTVAHDTIGASTEPGWAALVATLVVGLLGLLVACKRRVDLSRG